MTIDQPISLPQKREQLLAILAGYGRVAVAFSAGVDSTVVAKAAQIACGIRAVAVTAVSPSLASGELQAAEDLARQIGIRHRVIRTEEFKSPGYLQNAPSRCYFCKTELYSRMEGLLPELQADVIVNGANLDDRGDFRPGMQAASEHRVRSPLIEAECSKADVRELAQFWSLPVWDKPATPCLSSRIAYGVAVTPERVKRIDAAEQYVREALGLREFRVRLEANDLARLEVPVEAIPQFLAPEFRRELVGRLRSLGFRYITLDLEGFRSGSMNAVLPVESVQMPAGRGSR